MTGRHAQRTRIRNETTQSGRVRWVVRFGTFDAPANVWNVYPTWPAALRRAQRGGGRFYPVGWSSAGSGWLFFWRCTACSTYVDKPAAHGCMRRVPSFDELILPKPASRYPWSVRQWLRMSS